MSRFGPLEALGPQHDTSAVECGSDAQTTWLRRHALQAHRSDTTRVYVVCRKDTDRVVGYYALASGSIAPGAGSDRVHRGAGRYPVPVVILARLGVDLGEQGRRLGRALVRDALFQVLLIAELVGVRALLVHAETDRAVGYYDDLDVGFEPSPTDPMRLILMVKDLRAALRAPHGAEIRGPALSLQSILTAIDEARRDLKPKG